MKLKPEDLGKKFKTRDGRIAIMTDYCEDDKPYPYEFTLQYSDHAWTAMQEGYALSQHREDLFDIVERLPSKEDRIADLEKNNER